MQQSASKVVAVAKGMQKPGGGRAFALAQDHPFTANDNYPALVVTMREPTFEPVNDKATIYQANAALRVAVLVRRKTHSPEDLEALWKQLLRALLQAAKDDPSCRFRLEEAPQYEAQISGWALRVAVLRLVFTETLDLTETPV